ncbi:MAG: GyrI-like domain-containing protein [Defluviitaleaceae bacterium]|nr:GyrI-like domain-containing protein [Defluviitaleaceae bacterium]
MEPRIVDFAPKAVVGYEIIGGGNDFDKIPGFWAQVMGDERYPALQNLDCCADCTEYGAFVEYTDGGAFRYMICRELKAGASAPDGFATGQINGGKYAGFESSVEDCPKTFDIAYEWADKNGHKIPANGTSFELYDDRMANGILEVFVPLA